MFKILDVYIIRKFLGTYFFAILLILAITVMFDVNDKLDSFLKAPLKATIFDYFVNVRSKFQAANAALHDKRGCNRRTYMGSKRIYYSSGKH